MATAHLYLTLDNQDLDHAEPRILEPLPGRKVVSIHLGESLLQTSAFSCTPLALAAAFERWAEAIRAEHAKAVDEAVVPEEPWQARERQQEGATS